MKSKLFLKFFSGPKIGLLHSSRVEMPYAIERAADQIFHSLLKVGLEPVRGQMGIKLRRFGPGLPFADGIFADGNGSQGVVVFAPKSTTTDETDVFLWQALDPVPFFHAYEAGSPALLFSESLLPNYPELPEPEALMWPQTERIEPVSQGVNRVLERQGK